MKTDDLVLLLATGDITISRHAVARRMALALGSGVLLAGLMMFTLLGVREDLAEATRWTMFWGKLAYVAILAGISLLLVLRLARPGIKLEHLPLGLIVPVLAMWMLGAYALMSAEPAQRMELILGATWDKCPWLIAMLSTPIFMATLWAMRGLAPTRLSLAGASAGLLSGALAAVVYTLHCPEMAAPFIGLWYLLGMLIPAVAGALLGKYVLRW